MTQVAVLGSGPAGLLAALAVEQAGHEPIIFAKGDKSPMFGAMYLHEAIPGLNDPLFMDFEIDVIKVGNRDGYAYNVYGDRNAPCSWEYISEGTTPAWNLHEVYDKLWDRYSGAIRKYNIGPSDMGVICKNYPLVLCSIPAPAVCGKRLSGPHTFRGQDIWIIHGPGEYLLDGINDQDLMYYNGEPWDGSFATTGDEPIIGHEWYRYSQINRYQAWEYSRPTKIAEDNPRTLSTGRKPLGTDCDCWTAYPSFRRIGRFGTWEKGVLTHHAYREASQACHEML